MVFCALQVTKELEATVQYEKDLQHACVDGDSTYADRIASQPVSMKEKDDVEFGKNNTLPQPFIYYAP